MTEPVKTEVLLKGKLKMNFLSQHQFDTATKNPNELYYVPDSTESDISASIALHNNNQSSHPYILGQLDNKISKYDPLPIADEHVGEIVQYTGLTNPSTGYTHAFFYKSVLTHHESEVLQVASTSSSTLMPGDITIDAPTWRSKVTVGDTYTFTYDGSDWSLDNTVVDLSEYGLTIDPQATVSANDNFEVVYEPEVNAYSWVQQNVQPESLGTVTDVQVHGDSKLTGSVADLEVVEQCDQTTMPVPSQSLEGRIVQYTGANGLVSGYVHGYFYECKLVVTPSSVTLNVETQPDSQLSTVDCDKDSLEFNQGTTSNSWTFVSGGNWDWYLNGTEINLVDWGISYMGAPAQDDEIQLDYDASTSNYRWVPINVQPDAEPISSQEINALWE